MTSPAEAPRHLLVGGRRHGQTFTGHVGSPPLPIIRMPILPDALVLQEVLSDLPSPDLEVELYRRRSLWLGESQRRVPIYLHDSIDPYRPRAMSLVLEAALQALGVLNEEDR